MCWNIFDLIKCGYFLGGKTKMDAFGTIMLHDLNQLKYFPMQICKCRNNP